MEVIASPESVGLSSNRLKPIHTWMQKYLDQNRILVQLNIQDTGFAVPAAKADRLSALYECYEEDNLFLLIFRKFRNK